MTEEEKNSASIYVEQILTEEVNKRINSEVKYRTARKMVDANPKDEEMNGVSTQALRAMQYLDFEILSIREIQKDIEEGKLQF